MREMTPVTIVTKNIKYLGVTLNMEVKKWYDNNFKSLKKEIKKDHKKWKNFPCSWIGRNTIIKMAILPKATYRFNALPNKILSQYFIELEREIANSFGMKKKKTGKDLKFEIEIIKQ